MGNRRGNRFGTVFVRPVSEREGERELVDDRFLKFNTSIISLEEILFYYAASCRICHIYHIRLSKALTDGRWAYGSELNEILSKFSHFVLETLHESDNAEFGCRVVGERGSSKQAEIRSDCNDMTYWLKESELL